MDDSHRAYPPRARERQRRARTSTELFRYSTWVHVGPGAESASDARTALRPTRCTSTPGCRLPNQFQHQDIRERALAAKARRMRQLRDPDTDAYEILEAELDELRERRPRRDDRRARQSQRVVEAPPRGDGEVEEDEEYKHIERDRERLAELPRCARGRAPADEYAELERHLGAYDEAVEKARASSTSRCARPSRQLDDDELIEQIRDERMAAEASSGLHGHLLQVGVVRRHLHHRGPACTASCVRADRASSRAAAPEVIEALRRPTPSSRRRCSGGPGKLSAGDAWVDTVRIARDFGTVAELLPDGIEDVRDSRTSSRRSAPRCVILSFDELPEDERPPRRIWNDGEKLAVVRRRRAPARREVRQQGPGPDRGPGRQRGGQAARGRRLAPRHRHPAGRPRRPAGTGRRRRVRGGDPRAGRAPGRRRRRRRADRRQARVHADPRAPPPSSRPPRRTSPPPTTASRPP
jgi:hypothetical protein